MSELILKKSEITTLKNLILYGEVRNFYTGKGRFSKKSVNHVIQAKCLLERLRINKKHFEVSNDAPRGGWSGDYCKIKNSALNLSVFKRVLEEIRDEEFSGLSEKRLLS